VYVRAVGDVIEIGRADGSIAANAMSKAERAFDVVALRLAELSKLEQELSEAAYRDAEADFRTLSILLPVVVLLSIALSLLLTVAVRRALLGEIGDINAAALGLAQGDLTVRERDYGRDEIAETSRALDSSIRNLNATLSTILASAQSIDQATRAAAAEQAGLAGRAAAQAGSIGQTSLSLQALMANAGDSAGQAQMAGQLTLCAANFAVKGGSVVQRLVVTMAAIRGSSQKVFEMVGIVDGIAVQSRLLALNAAAALSADPARAGEAARSLASFEKSARALAERSAGAAETIKDLVAATAEDIAGGSHAAGEAGSGMVQMVDAVLECGRIVELIGQAGARQLSDLSEVKQAILQVGEMSRENSALVNAAAAAAAGLQHQANHLSQAVAGFRLDALVQEGQSGADASDAGEARDARNGEGGGPPETAKKNAGPERVARLRLASNRE
jgi:methyl-accepting chemotaxis protein